ncbi:zinc-ribbon domain-containing protein [Citrobacter sp. XY323]|uniref:zinc-ribbon domain-containing protein n=1 Tax=Citrobacter sp. XY323 TaxID=2976537 RepID=UPI0021820EE4|nr:zinc-ribbon domain-containing protein [Citrobacter sp. XY323]MCS8554355.1 zinc-ribbon domain-containing protein [Citrobacter sp. XY323]
MDTNIFHYQTTIQVLIIKKECHLTEIISSWVLKLIVWRNGGAAPAREDLTENGRYLCPYVHPEPQEARRVRMLRRYVPDVLPILHRAGWHCSGCDNEYHGERYCRSCQTGDHSTEIISSEGE